MENQLLTRVEKIAIRLINLVRGALKIHIAKSGITVVVGSALGLLLGSRSHTIAI